MSHGLQFQQMAVNFWQNFRFFSPKNRDRLKYEDNIFETIFPHRHLPVDTLDSALLTLTQKRLPPLRKILDKKRILMKRKRLKFSQTFYKNTLHKVSLDRKKTVSKSCSKNVAITPILLRSKVPEQLEWNKNFFERIQFFGNIFLRTQRKQFWQCSRENFGGVLKKTGVKHRKSWKKRKGNSLKLKNTYSSHFSFGKDQSSFDNLLKKAGQNFVLCSLKNAKTIKRLKK